MFGGMGSNSPLFPACNDSVSAQCTQCMHACMDGPTSTVAALALGAWCGVVCRRYSFPHAKISTAPPIVNRVFGQTVDAQLQAAELEYATKYYAAILARSTQKDLETCQKEYLSRKRWVAAGAAAWAAAAPCW